MDLTPSSMQLVRVLSGIKEPPTKAPLRGLKATPDLSKLGELPDSYKEEILRKSRAMAEGSSSRGATNLPGRDSDQANNEVHNDKATAQPDDDDLAAEENAALMAYKKSIEQECDEEARRDEKILQQNIDEAMKEIMSDDDD